MMALGYYEHGTHFLRVADDGQITRRGYFVPVAGSTSAAYWINRNIVYAVDYTRGIDILRYTGSARTAPDRREPERHRQGIGALTGRAS
jgi:hypothetical protein